MSTTARAWRTKQVGDVPIDAPSLPATFGGDGRWLLVFIVFQIVCNLALLSTTLGGGRIFFRSAAFISSLALVAILRDTGARHVARAYALTSIGILGISFFNPSTNNAVGGAVHVLLYAAILAPVFWVPRLDITTATLRRALLIMWSFHALSALVGTLQVYNPNGPLSPQFDPNSGLTGLYITLASGETIFRPSGLSDAPGAAAASGFYAVLLGVGFLLERPKWYVRMVILTGMFLGMFVLYLCQVRSLLVMLAICVLAVLFMLALQGRTEAVIREGALIVGLVVVSFIVAAGVGGDDMINRVSTLFENDATTVYYDNRGKFLEHTITVLLPQYPLGAGLGHWGMMYYYFGNYASPDIYVEIQWTGWLIDGGVPLVLVYTAGLITTLVFAASVARRKIGAAHDGLWVWAAVIFGYDLGSLALTFNYALFIGQLGLEFWLLNAALFTAAVRSSTGSEEALAVA